MAIGSFSDSRPPTARPIDRERTVVRAAVLMVAEGASPRVTVVGMRHAGRLVRESRQLVDEAGIDVRAEDVDGSRRRTIVIERPPG